MTSKKRERRGKTNPASEEELISSAAVETDSGEEVTTYKVYKRDARILSKLGAMLEMPQQDTIAHFRRQFEDLLLILLAKEQKRIQSAQE